MLLEPEGGWIKVNRSIRDSVNWPKGSYTPFEAELDLRLAVNHQPKQINENLVVKRGQLLTSIYKLAERWRWSRRRVRRFLNRCVAIGVLEVTDDVRYDISGTCHEAAVGSG